MQITVLGKSPAWQDADGACSGYLVEDGGTRVLLDCGNGVFSKLRAKVDYVDVDAVVISHLHADHFFDLVPYAYALLFSPRHRPEGEAPPSGPAPRRLPLYAPRGAAVIFDAICRNFHNTPLIEYAFEIHEYDPGAVLDIGSLRIELREVPHYVTTCAIAVTAPASGSGRFVYGADCAPSEELVEFARDCDLMMLESTLRHPEQTEPRGHLTPGEAGDHARRAGAARLVLTHITDEIDPEHARSDAEAAFGSDVHVVAHGDVFEV